MGYLLDLLGIGEKKDNRAHRKEAIEIIREIERDRRIIIKMKTSKYNFNKINEEMIKILGNFRRKFEDDVKFPKRSDLINDVKNLEKLLGIERVRLEQLKKSHEIEESDSPDLLVSLNIIKNLISSLQTIRK